MSRNLQSWPLVTAQKARSRAFKFRSKMPMIPVYAHGAGEVL